jgi:hypothetical protein
MREAIAAAFLVLVILAIAAIGAKVILPYLQGAMPV